MENKLKLFARKFGTAHINLMLDFLEWVEKRLPTKELEDGYAETLSEILEEVSAAPSEAKLKIKGLPISEAYDGFPILAKFPSLKPEFALGHIVGVANFTGNCLTVEFHSDFPPSNELITNVMLEGVPINPSVVQLRIVDHISMNLYFSFVSQN